jgi:2-desacetyl-2-hydroxyethyl bacteriochlorophyllide A dehydrogenase
MKAILLSEPGTLTPHDAPEPLSPGEGEALVRVHRIGLCGTDYHAFHGRQPFFSYPRILGHELGVEVLEVGPGVTKVSKGDRCSVEPYLHCGKCAACRKGLTNCCANIAVLGVHTDGGMRERLVVPAAKLHPSKSLPYEAMALVETLAIGAHAIDRSRLEKGETLVVIGAGPIGLSVIQFGLLKGARVLVIDLTPSRLEACRNLYPAVITLDPELPSERPFFDQVSKLTDGDLADVVVDATGNLGSMGGSLAYAGQGGRVVYVGLAQGDVTFNDPLFHRREITLFASRNALPHNFTSIIAAMEAGEINTQSWITHRCTLEELPVRLPEWSAPAAGVIKAIASVTD